MDVWIAFSARVGFPFQLPFRFRFFSMSVRFHFFSVQIELGFELGSQLPFLFPSLSSVSRILTLLPLQKKYLTLNPCNLQKKKMASSAKGVQLSLKLHLSFGRQPRFSRSASVSVLLAVSASIWVFQFGSQLCFGHRVYLL